MLDKIQNSIIYLREKKQYIKQNIILFTIYFSLIIFIYFSLMSKLSLLVLVFTVFLYLVSCIQPTT